MKRFISLLLCVVLPFMFLCPLSSKALDIQGTEYPTPSFLPIDVDFSEYDYYFVTVSGKPENPSYRFYFFKDTNKSGRLYVSAFLSASSTCFHSGEFTSFGVTTNYETFYSSYNTSSGSWIKLSSPSSSYLSVFAFDGYSEFSNSFKYIIGCNADIYDYSGNLVRKGDYDNLISYFIGGLNGSSDKSEKPTEPTTSGGSGSGNPVGLSPVDLDFFSDSFNGILDSLNAVATAIEAMTIAASTKIIEDTLEEIKTGVNNVSFVISENFNQFTETFSQKISALQSDLFDFKKVFLEFASVDGEIKKLAQLFSSINQSISLLKTGLTDTIEQITNDFNDFADDVKSNVLSIRIIVNDFTEKFNTIISGISGLKSSVVDGINGLLGKLSDIYSKLSTVSYYAEWINKNLVSFSNDFIEFGNAFFEHLRVIESHLSFIKGDVSDIYNLLLTYCYNMADVVTDIRNYVSELPDRLGELLEYLFIPKEEHFTKIIDEINEHFGFVHQIIKLGDALAYNAKFDDVQPSYSISFNSDTYGHFKADIIDLSVVAPYISIIKAINTGIILYFFIRRTRKRLPYIINGTGGD